MILADGEFWSPTLIDTWRRLLRRGVADDGTLRHRYAFVSNIGYNLQYLQFLDYQRADVPLHATVYTQTLKSFVITGMGVVEAVCWYVLKKHGWNKTEQWERIADLKTSDFEENDSQYRIVNSVERRSSRPIEVEMSLQWMIRQVEKRKLLGMDRQVYKDLNYLRGLRNKVHIHVVQHDTDTDWNSFNNNEFKLMKKALHGVLTSALFEPLEEEKRHLEFLRVEESTDELAEDIPF